MKNLFFPIALALLIGGCASPSAPLDTSKTYQVEWIGERPLIDRSHLTVTFDKDGRAHGHGGCNRWFASYQLEGQNLSFSHAGATRMACAPALMEQENRFFQALDAVQRWDLGEHGELRLWPQEGQPIKLFAGEARRTN
ncbi:MULTISPECIES: META domain-containing protein [Pseudomonas]|uniref:META domain-containing protein n=1 Tax=Serpens gallinarum TaxID=2763075 RepID=A0ABR8TS03_9PSED|nr:MULTISPECIES: META domain-containing protein [Pseudomonas]MBD7978565.1 META domain-containing protein [Serpens gallinarum]MBF0676092.1 META domain-containing protein [Pseudomonas sp.]